MNTAVVKSVFKMVGVGVLGLFLFSLAVAGAKGDVNLGKVLWDRIEPMTKDDGVKNSNRNYVYTYLEEQQVGWFGDGMGNSNLKFTQATGLDATASFLNLFVNVMLSLGYIGLGLFGVFILTPFVILFANRRYHFQSDHYLILSAFFGWLIVFIAHSEELSFHFAITYALLVHSFSQQKPLPMGAT